MRCAAASARRVDGRDSVYASYDYLSTWTAIAQEVRDLAVREARAGRPREEIARAVEQAAVLDGLLQPDALRRFRAGSRRRWQAGALALHGWWFNMTEGQLYAFNPANATFEAVHGIAVTPTIVKGTALSAIRPERLLATVAGKKPAFLTQGRATARGVTSALKWRDLRCGKQRRATGVARPQQRRLHPQRQRNRCLSGQVIIPV